MTAVAVGLAALASSLALERVLRLLPGGLQHTLRDLDVPYRRPDELRTLEALVIPFSL
jgi:hypothetical protein